MIKESELLQRVHYKRAAKHTVLVGFAAFFVADPTVGVSHVLIQRRCPYFFSTIRSTTLIRAVKASWRGEPNGEADTLDLDA